MPSAHPSQDFVSETPRHHIWPKAQPDARYLQSLWTATEIRSRAPEPSPAHERFREPGSAGITRHDPCPMSILYSGLTRERPDPIFHCRSSRHHPDG
jgi:hypothetical protein